MLHNFIKMIFDKYEINDNSCATTCSLFSNLISSSHYAGIHTLSGASTHTRIDSTRHSIDEIIKYALHVIWGRGSLFHPLSSTLFQVPPARLSLFDRTMFFLRRTKMKKAKKSMREARSVSFFSLECSKSLNKQKTEMEQKHLMQSIMINSKYI